MTYLMKFKPIDVGYKFFALNDSKTGWCYVVIPEGLADEEKEGMLFFSHAYTLQKN